MQKVLVGLVFTAVSSMALAGGVEGVWNTEVSKKTGGHLEVTVAPCQSDTAKMCGTITKAFGKDGVDTQYPNLGKLMVKDMESKDGKSFSDGTIWDPEADKTYKSKMTLKGDDLDVEGCISFFCSGQDWKRVQ